MKSKVIFISVLFIMLSFSLVFGGVPKMINYQGKITTPQGALIDTIVTMTFAIYNDSIGTDSLWSEDQDSVKVEKGIFSVLLGSVEEIPDSVFDGSIRYLGVKVGSDAEMAPRKAIVSVGYAYKSEYADTADYAQVAVSDGDWTIDGDNIHRLTGNVGIGTTSPGSLLEISTNIAAHTNLLRLSNLQVPGYRVGIEFYEGSGGGGVASTIEGSDYLIFKTAGPSALSEAMIIDSNGKVGIGTTNPDEKLAVDGNVHITGDLIVDGASISNILMDYGYEDNISQCGSRDVSFNVIFSSPPVVIVGYKGDIGCDEHGNWSAYNVTTNGFTIRNARPEHSRNAYWIAIGPGQ